MEKENVKMVEINLPTETTDHEGSEDFPVEVNEYLALVEKIAVQEMDACESANVYRDGLVNYEVDNGSVIEKSVVDIARSEAFNRDAWDKTPIDPKIVARYWNNWEKRQYGVTIRRDDIRKIIANKGLSPNKVAEIILDTLQQGEGHEDYVETMKLLSTSKFVDYSKILNGHPKNVRGLIYAARDMYNHCKYNNNDLTSDHDFIMATKPTDIRVALSSEIMNLMDVAELVDAFNLSKEELFGQLVIYDLTFLKAEDKSITYERIRELSSMLFVYDINALGKAVRLREITKDDSGKGRFTNFYLTIDRLYFHCGLFKGAKLDCSVACKSARSELIEEGSVTKHKVTTNVINGVVDQDIPEIEDGAKLDLTFTADSGFTFSGQRPSVKMGDIEPKFDFRVSEDGHNANLSIQNVTADVTIDLEAIQE